MKQQAEPRSQYVDTLDLKNAGQKSRNYFKNTRGTRDLQTVAEEPSSTITKSEMSAKQGKRRVQRLTKGLNRVQQMSMSNQRRSLPLSQSSKEHANTCSNFDKSASRSKASVGQQQMNIVYSDDINTSSNKSPKEGPSSSLIIPPRAANATQKTVKPFSLKDDQVFEEIDETCGDILSSSNDDSVPVKEISISGSQVYSSLRKKAINRSISVSSNHSFEASAVYNSSKKGGQPMVMIIPDSPQRRKVKKMRKLKLLDDSQENHFRTLEDSDTRTRTPIAQKKKVYTTTNKKVIKSNQSYTKTFALVNSRNLQHLERP